ncbi:MAG: response regulator transcription factor [Gemmatimonadales bacterium]|nr:response regulator transcription factor [Gemmatimonadales bacterium]
MTDRVSHVLIADDHQIFAEGVARILRDRGYIVSIVTQLAVLEGTLAAVSPDLLILDLTFGRESAMPLLKRLRIEMPSLRIIVLSARDEAVIIEAVEKTGTAYLTKTLASTELLALVRSTLADRRPAATVTVRPGRETAFVTVGAVSLSRRQIKVLLGVHRGASSTEIAESMQVTRKAIEPHLRALRERIGVNSRAELARWAQEHLEELRG